MSEEDPESAQTMRGVVGGTQLFNRFTLQKVLGRGGMGIVWLARDDRLDRLVALKLVPDAVCFDASAQEDLKRETRKSLLLTHPNIVRIFDFIEDERTAAISMEYVDGATLSYLRVQKPAKCFEVGELLPWVSSLCQALTYAHDSVRIIHRDLKPANLMVNSRSELKITDFGIACSLRDSMSCISVRTSSGTLNYMSPQQMLGEDPARSDDIYALGALLYELLSSKPPFYGGDVGLQVREVTPTTIAVRRTKLEIQGEPIPAHWEETIAACLAKNPARRPQSADEVGRRLRLNETLDPSDSSAVTTRNNRPQIRSHVVSFGGGVLALLAAILILQHSPFSARPSKPETARIAPPPAPAHGYAIEVPRKQIAAASDYAPATPVAAPRPSTPAPATPAKLSPATVRLTTTPPGATFAVYPGALAGSFAPEMDPLRSGTAPDAITDLPPGHYTVLFHHEGWPDDRTEISLHSGETLPVDYTYPHGSVTITSTPDEAEILLGERSLGRTPLTIDLPLGKQTLTAQHSDFPKRTETVSITADEPAKVAFTLRSRSRSSHTSHKAKPKPTPSSLDKIGNTLKKFFGSKPTPTPKPRKKRKHS